MMTAKHDESDTVTRADLGALVATLLADRDVRADTHVKVCKMYQALMVPQPGHEHSLLERMAAVTIAAETGQAAGDRLVRTATIIGAASAISAAIVGMVKFLQMGGKS